MVAAVDWSGVPLAGAFVIGAVAGGVAVIRVTRWVLEYMARRDRE
jgi:hypothetical protein